MSPPRPSTSRFGGKNFERGPRYRTMRPSSLTRARPWVKGFPLAARFQLNQAAPPPRVGTIETGVSPLRRLKRWTRPVGLIQPTARGFREVANQISPRGPAAISWTWVGCGR